MKISDIKSRLWRRAVICVAVPLLTVLLAVCAVLTIVAGLFAGMLDGLVANWRVVRNGTRDIARVVVASWRHP